MSTSARLFTPPSFHPDRPHLFLPVRADPKGAAGPTVFQTKNVGWRRTSHRFYLPARISNEHPHQRIVEASVVLPHGGAVTGWAALAWLDERGWFDGLDGEGAQLAVPLQVPHRRIRCQAGMRLVSERLLPGDLLTVGGLPIVRPERAIIDELRRAPELVTAVAWMDLAAVSDLVSIAEVRDYLSRMSGHWQGLLQAARALDLAEENVWSWPESELRMVWRIKAGVTTPLLCNVPLFDRDGRHIGTPDLFDPETGVAGEYDGAGHLDGRQRSRDLVREGRFRAAGIETVVMVGADRRAPYGYARRVIEARRRGIARSSEFRAWTLEKPAYWRATETVEQRRALPDHFRPRFLRRPPGRTPSARSA